MIKRKIRCYKALANVYPGVFNYPVFYLTYEGWSNFSFGTCIRCGELFVIDWENPKTEGLSVQEIAETYNCPTCNAMLNDTLRNYPQVIRLPGGEFGSYTPDGQIPPDKDSVILELYEIKPS